MTNAKYPKSHVIKERSKCLNLKCPSFFQFWIYKNLILRQHSPSIYPIHVSFKFKPNFREIIQIHPNFKLLRLIMTQLNFWLNFGNRTGILRPLARLSFHPSSAIEQRSRTENLCRGRAEWFTVAKRKTANEAGLRTGNNLMRIPGTLASDSIRLSSNL